jgi:hypothetical protein
MNDLLYESVIPRQAEESAPLVLGSRETALQELIPQALRSG